MRPLSCDVDYSAVSAFFYVIHLLTRFACTADNSPNMHYSQQAPKENYSDKLAAGMEECCVEVHLHVGGHLKEIGFRKKTFLIHSKFMLGVNHHFPGNILLCNKLAGWRQSTACWHVASTLQRKNIFSPLSQIFKSRESLSSSQKLNRKECELNTAAYGIKCCIYGKIERVGGLKCGSNIGLQMYCDFKASVLPAVSAQPPLLSMVYMAV